MENRRIICLDSLSYSFALDNLDVKDTVINVVVKIMGMPVDEDRAYTVELVRDETTATSEDWDAGILNNRFYSGRCNYRYYSYSCSTE